MSGTKDKNVKSSRRGIRKKKKEKKISKTTSPEIGGESRIKEWLQIYGIKGEIRM